MKVTELIYLLETGIKDGSIDASADVCTVAANHTNHSVWHSPIVLRQIDSTRTDAKVLLIGDIHSSTYTGNL